MNRSLLFLVTFTVALACHPESRWLCDNPCGNWTCTDPVCPVLCEPVCNSRTACVCFNNISNASYPHSCQQRCPPDQCESDSCPACETLCPNRCDAGYVALCEPTDCEWRCRLDPTCPQPDCQQQDPSAHCDKPRCVLMGEHPACEYSGSSTLSLLLALLLL